MIFLEKKRNIHPTNQFAILRVFRESASHSTSTALVTVIIPYHFNPILARDANRR